MKSIEIANIYLSKIKFKKPKLKSIYTTKKIKKTLKTKIFKFIKKL